MYIKRVLLTVVVVLVFEFVPSIFTRHFFKPQTKDVITFSEKELSCLIHSEAKANDIDDMLLVGSVVLNRVNFKRFPESLFEVIHQRGQFDGVSTRNFKRSELSDMVAVYLLRGGLRDYRVLFFFNSKTATDQKFINYIYKKYSFIRRSRGHVYFGIK